MPHLSQPDAILFDLDETLTDRLRSIERWAVHFARDYADCLGTVPFGTLASIARSQDGYGDRPREEVFTSLLELVPWRRAPTVDELLAYWNRTFPGCCVAREGVREVLPELRARGIRLGVVTNGGIEMQAAKIDAIAIRPYVDTIVISAQVGVEKPDPRIFRLALDTLGVVAEGVWFVGDHPHNDMLGAAGAGLTPVWLRGIRPWPDELPAPEWQIDTLGDLLRLVDASAL